LLDRDGSELRRHNLVVHPRKKVFGLCPGTGGTPGLRKLQR
jgi:hypothetical protein